MFFKKRNKAKAGILTIKGTEQRRLPASELYPGMYVSALDIPWEDSTFLFQGFKLQNWEDVDAVAAQCKEVVVDFAKTERINLVRRHFDNEEPVVTTRIKPNLKTEIGKATDVYKQTSGLVRNIMDDVRLGNVIDTQATKQAISDTVDSIMRSPDAMMMLTRIREADQHTAQHSLNVSVLSVAFGKALGLERRKLEELGVAALLHDVGKVLTPSEILNKAGKLTAEEYEIIKRHPKDGRDILASNGNLPPGAIDVAYSHHEHIDGTGYPRGLYGHQTTLWSKVVAITETYDDLTSDTPYREGDSNINAFRVLNSNGKKQFDAFLVTRFISVIGIFPPGSIVLMNSGESGVVVESHENHALSPSILLLRDAEGVPIEPRLINLMEKPQANGLQEIYKIKAVLKNRQTDINLLELKEKGFMLDGA